MFKDNNRRKFLSQSFTANRNIIPQAQPSFPTTSSTNFTTLFLRQGLIRISSLPQIFSPAKATNEDSVTFIKKDFLWLERLKAIRYGERYLGKDNQEIDWEEYKTPCIPDKWINKWSVDDELISEVIMWGHTHRNALDGKSIRKKMQDAKILREKLEKAKDLTEQRDIIDSDSLCLLKQNADVVLLNANTPFVHLSLTNLEDLKKAKSRVENEILLEETNLVTHLNDKMAALIKKGKEIEAEELASKTDIPAILFPLKDSLSKITQSIDLYNTELSVKKYIPLFIEWYQITYLNDKKDPAQSNQLLKNIHALGYPEDDITNIKAVLAVENEMVKLKRSETSLGEVPFKQIKEKLQSTIMEGIQTLRKMMPKIDKMSATSLVILKYIYEAELTHHIELFVSTQEKLAALKNKESVLLSRVGLEDLSDEAFQKLSDADFKIQEKIRLNDTIETLITSKNLLRGAIQLNDILASEDQTYFELEQEVKWYHRCATEFAALTDDNLAAEDQTSLKMQQEMMHHTSATEITPLNIDNRLTLSDLPKGMRILSSSPLSFHHVVRNISPRVGDAESVEGLSSPFFKNR